MQNCLKYSCFQKSNRKIIFIEKIYLTKHELSDILNNDNVLNTTTIILVWNT